jgi:hypothetical protein
MVDFYGLPIDIMGTRWTRMTLATLTDQHIDILESTLCELRSMAHPDKALVEEEAEKRLEASIARITARKLRPTPRLTAWEIAHRVAMVIGTVWALGFCSAMGR